MLLKLLFPFLALIAGMAVVVQGQINGGLGRKIGVIEGAFFSFALGTLVLLLILIFLGNGQISAINTVPKWQLLGGILGVFFCYRSSACCSKNWCINYFASSYCWADYPECHH